MNPKQIRQISIQTIVSLGFPKPPNTLPVNDDLGCTKPASSIIARCASLTAVISCCFGFDKRRALMWLEKYNADQTLTTDEHFFLTTDPNNKDLVGKLETRVEALWALCWSLKFFSQLDWTQYCGKNLKQLTPNIETDEPLSTFENRASLRKIEEIVQQEDVAYCLDWVIVEAKLKKGPTPGKLRSYAIRERRHALTWILSKEKWDDISLDT